MSNLQKRCLYFADTIEVETSQLFQKNMWHIHYTNPCNLISTTYSVHFVVLMYGPDVVSYNYFPASIHTPAAKQC